MGSNKELLEIVERIVMRKNDFLDFFFFLEKAAYDMTTTVTQVLVRARLSSSGEILGMR